MCSIGARGMPPGLAWGVPVVSQRCPSQRRTWMAPPPCQDSLNASTGMGCGPAVEHCRLDSFGLLPDWVSSEPCAMGSHSTPSKRWVRSSRVPLGRFSTQASIGVGQWVRPGRRVDACIDTARPPSGAQPLLSTVSRAGRDVTLKPLLWCTVAV